jgi:hypothetical protein
MRVGLHSAAAVGSRAASVSPSVPLAYLSQSPPGPGISAPVAHPTGRDDDTLRHKAAVLVLRLRALQTKLCQESIGAEQLRRRTQPGRGPIATPAVLPGRPHHPGADRIDPGMGSSSPTNPTIDPMPSCVPPFSHIILLLFLYNIPMICSCDNGKATFPVGLIRR